MVRTIGRSLGLEVWATGTWDEIAALRAQLAALGLLAIPEPDPTHPAEDPLAPVPLPGERGRYRWYGRVRVRDA